jgi:hypothetical protein
MKQFRLTIILLAAAACLGAYVWFFEREATGTIILWKVDARAVRRIQLTSGKERTVVERRGKIWRITKPVAARVDRTRMDELLDRVAKVEARRRIEEPGKLKDYGLAKPAAGIVVALANGRSHALSLGRKTPDNSAVYAMERGRARVFLVDTGLLDDAVGGAGMLRDRRALPFAARNLQGIVLARPGSRVVLEKRGKYWRIAAPIKVSADPDAVANFLAALGELEASRFAAEKPADLSGYGLARPRLTIKLEFAPRGGKTMRLDFGADAGSQAFYARNSVEPAVMVVPGASFDRVNRTLGSLRSKQIAAIDVDNIERIAVAGGGRRFELIRARGKRWMLTSPVRMEADSETVQSLLWALSDLRATGFIDAPGSLVQYGLNAPRAAVTVWAARRENPVRLWFGGPVPSSATPSIYVKASGATVYHVSAAVLKQLPGDANALRSLTLVSHEPGSITRVQAVFDGKTVALQRSGTAWNLTAPQKRKARPERVDELLGLIGNVRARAFVRDSTDATLTGYGSESGTLKLTIEAEKQKPETLGVRQIGEVTYVRRGDQPAVFRAAPGFLHELKQALTAVSGG